MGVIQNSLIEADIDASEATVVSAKKVLLAEYESITKKDVCKKFDGHSFIRVGHELQVSDAWKDFHNKKSYFLRDNSAYYRAKSNSFVLW